VVVVDVIPHPPDGIRGLLDAIQHIIRDQRLAIVAVLDRARVAVRNI
jgi:hypothetical protein